MALVDPLQCLPDTRFLSTHHRWQPNREQPHLIEGQQLEAIEPGL